MRQYPLEQVPDTGDRVFKSLYDFDQLREDPEVVENSKLSDGAK